ncbi:hypothetical protein L1987_75093 [Smallanthus sonchifolius]|uniref:Uncharacterized protein n=1 Tax=Smallanthus sonchifolius TaxID=185202 RepID=A0ACB9A3S1_9ASTR|nr:hypothetical protein L1987_75093 [Smallanthus sonchifolius]
MIPSIFAAPLSSKLAANSRRLTLGFLYFIARKQRPLLFLRLRPKIEHRLFCIITFQAIIFCSRTYLD